MTRLGLTSRALLLRLCTTSLALASLAPACSPGESPATGNGSGGSGIAATGGRSATGGGGGTGGAPTGSTGGTMGSGGASTGGATGSGGDQGTSGSGGNSSTGGATGSGGASTGGGGGGAAGATVLGSGGSSAAGGSTASTGGNSGSAGSTPSGGAAGSGTPSTGFSVVTNRYDNARSGANLQEKTLTTANVNQASFGLLFSRAVDGQMYAQPLYLGGLLMPDNRVHNVVFAATQHNTVYAFDADSATATAPLWSRNLGPSGPVSVYSCADMLIEVGITATPTIDKATGTLFVVAKGREGTTWVQRLHALDVKTGAQKPGSPVVITASIPGTGDGSAGGMLTFNAMTHLNRAGLLFQNGMVYIAFASHCDGNPYHGWVLGYSYDGTKLTQTRTYNTSRNGSRGGIWQSGVGISADEANLYLVAGNGSTNPAANPPDLSESVIKLGISDFAVKDYWTPTAYVALNRADADLSTGAILMPHNLLLTGSKDGRLYVLDSANLGKYSSSADVILQTLMTPGKANGERGHLHGGPIYYSSGGVERVFLWPEQTNIMAYRLDPTTRRLGSLVQSTVFAAGHPGGFLSLSSNAGAAGTGILWGSMGQADAWHATVRGTLYAVDAVDITRVLWTSQQNVARDAVGNFAKTVPPVVANGKVYLSTFSNALKVYGLLN